MRPSQEYLNSIASKLDSLRRADPNKVSGPVETYKIPSFEDQIGQTALAYLNQKKEIRQEKDPLFPDRNTY
jgi:hypothetical protein